MGEFSKLLSQKTDLEITKLGDTILDYQALFIFDYFSELEKRDLLFDYKILISNMQLINIAIKIKNLPDTKYFDLLLKEIDHRKISVEFEKSIQKITEEETDKKNNRWYFNLFEKIITIFFITCFAIGWILYKEGIIFNFMNKKNQENSQGLPPYKFNEQTELPSIKVNNDNPINDIYSRKGNS